MCIEIENSETSCATIDDQTHAHPTGAQGAGNNNELKLAVAFSQ